MPKTEVLLADFDMNCGMQRFMLKLDSVHSIVEAVEHASELDENLWPQVVVNLGSLDVLHAGKMNPGFRAEPAQIRYLLEFARRNYRAICIDLSGNMEKYSIEIMHESKRIFLVCTPEVPSLHLAREKYLYLQSMDLGDRVNVLLNRTQKRNVISPAQVESLLGLPVHMAFANEYKGVHQALTEARHVDPASELGPAIRQAKQLANRELIVVASVTGTEQDPQRLSAQVAALKAAGAIVCDSNAAAAKLVAMIVG